MAAILNHHLSCDNTAALFFHSDVVLIFAFPHLWSKVCYLHGRTIVPSKVRSDAMDSIHQLPICSRAASINTSNPSMHAKMIPPKHTKFKRESKPGCLTYRSCGTPITWPTRHNMHVLQSSGHSLHRGCHCGSVENIKENQMRHCCARRSVLSSFLMVLFEIFDPYGEQFLETSTEKTA